MADMIRHPTFLIQSLGCKVNQYDGNRINEQLVLFGFQPAEADAEPDLVILNSCAVTGRASQKARQALNAFRRKWPVARIILAGCEAKLRQIQENPTEDADAVITPSISRDQLREVLLGLGLKAGVEAGVSLTQEIAEAARNHESPLEAMARNLSPEKRTREFLKIQDGCEHFCSYCIIPHLRGKETSKPLEAAIGEARKLAQMGHREIVITGIHLGHYQFGLENLLAGIEVIDGLDRIRLSSIEPLEISAPLIDWISRSPKSCLHLHLPLQSGSDAILRKMNRPYDTAGFAQIVDRVRGKIPEIAITTDLIVGFPGETEELFQETLRFVEKMAFSRMHIFRYSPRPGTPAADFKDQVSASAKKERARKIEEVHIRCAEAFHRRFLGQTVHVLWETNEQGRWQGFSREYIPCRLSEEARDLTNTITSAMVIAANSEGVEVDFSS